MDIKVDPSNTMNIYAEDYFRTNLTCYMYREVQPFVWDKLFQECRIGTFLFTLSDYVTPKSQSLEDVELHLKDLGVLAKKIITLGGKVILTFQGVPKWLSSDPNNENIIPTIGKVWHSVPPKDYNLWQEFVYRVVKYFNITLSLRNRMYYAIGSEPDNYWLGTEAEFFQYYISAVKGAKMADLGSKIGGITPSTLRSTKYRNQVALPYPILYNWIQFCSKNNLPIDFITFHDYPSTSNNIYAYMVIKDWANKFGFQNSELILTDWPEWKDDPKYDTNYKSAWLTYRATELVGKHWAYNLLRDTKIDETLARLNYGYGGGNGLYTKQGAVKATYNAFKLMSKMEGKLLWIPPQSSGQNAIAAYTSNRLYILTTDFYSGPGSYPAGVTITGLANYHPVKSFKSYVIDEVSSNPYTFRQFSPNAEYFNAYQDIYVQNGQVTSTNRYSTILFEIGMV